MQTGGTGIAGVTGTPTPAPVGGTGGTGGLGGGQPPIVPVSDLVPAGVTVNSRVNGSLTVYDYLLAVKNIGQANAGSFNMGMYNTVTGVLMGTCSIGSVSVGWTQSCLITNCPIKYARVNEVADVGNVIVESNEANNAMNAVIP